ncbi:hypothetical protein [Streptomyces sp. E5N298]|uniref:hypothetical protein n=1 Tax=Streptomyces sp. E5N298 TaxID=1851983 RepID=UPI000EF56CDA|nr:hypothetical protein [Streptomyces sp. E5N298]
MESATAASERLRARRQELTAELEQVQRQLNQLETHVVVSQWWQAPSGSMGRGTVYHTGTDERCRPSSKPDEITLYEALQAGLVPCRTCKPRNV